MKKKAILPTDDLRKTVVFKPKAILITGGAGFIGSNVLKYLWAKYPKAHFHVVDALTYAGDIRNLDQSIRESDRFSFWYENILNERVMDKVISMCDHVIHFAAETHVSRSIVDDKQFIETDMMGTEVILSSILKHRKNIRRFIHISTSEVYGTSDRQGKMSEDHPLNPQSPYAAAKAGADRLVYSYFATYQLPAVIIRPFNLYGSNQHPEKVIPRFITSMLRGELLTIHGEGKSQRDFTHTSDLAAALDLVLQAPAERVDGQVFNVGSEKAVSVLEIAKSISDIMSDAKKNMDGKSVNVGDRLGQVEKHWCNATKIKKILGWRPKVSFAAGLRSTVKWYSENVDWWEPKIFMRHVKVMTKNGKVEKQ